MQTRTKITAILAGLLFAFLVTTGVLYGLSVRQRNRAQAFMREFTRLELGKSSFTEAQLLARTYEGIPWYVAPDDMRCTFQRCLFAFKFDNKPLIYLRFVHYTGLFAFVSVRDGVVVGRQLEYGRISNSSYEFRYLVIDSANDLPGSHWPYGTVPQMDPKGIPRTVLVSLGPLSPPLERADAYSLDLGCLARWYGCGVPSSYYPPRISYEGEFKK